MLKDVPSSKDLAGGNQPKTGKSYTILQKRVSHADAYKPWTHQLDEELMDLFKQGMSMSQLTEYFNRTKGAIISRLTKLGYYVN